MSASVRILALGACAFLLALGAVAVVQAQEDENASPEIRSAPAPGGGWYHGLAASHGPAGDAERTSCGLVLTARSYGVSHPTLPCGARLLLRYGGQTVLTTVIDHRLSDEGRQFELTDRLAALFGLDGTQQIDWRFAVRSS